MGRCAILYWYNYNFLTELTMIRELKDSQSYPRVIALISVLSVFFGIATCVLGELLLPLSSAFMATLFLLEKPKKRFLS